MIVDCIFVKTQPPYLRGNAKAFKSEFVFELEIPQILNRKSMEGARVIAKCCLLHSTMPIMHRLGLFCIYHK